MTCQLCKEFYDKYPLILDEETGEWEHVFEEGASDPIECAFDESGKFLNINWCCETMHRLRNHAKKHLTWSQDHNIGVIPFSSEGLNEFYSFLVLYWYKNRGRTDQALIFGSEPCSLTLDVAEFVIKKEGLDGLEDNT